MTTKLTQLEEGAFCTSLIYSSLQVAEPNEQGAKKLDSIKREKAAGVNEHPSNKTSNLSVKDFLQSSTQEKFYATFNSGFSLKLILDRDLKIVVANQAFRNFFKPFLSVGFLEGIPVFDLGIFNRTNADHLNLTLEKAQTDGEQRYLETIALEKKNHFFEILVKPILAESKDESAFYVIDMHDVTELERNKTALSESRLQMDKQEGEFRKMARLVSHDLRAPATNLSYLLSILEKSGNEKKEEEVMEGLKVSVEKILQTLTKVGGSLNERLEQVDAKEQSSLRKIIDEALETYSVQMDRQNARVIVDIYDNSDWKVPHGILKMTLTQLVSNSLKYARPGQVPEVIITAFRRDGNRIIQVKDKGVGIDLKGQEQRLFGLFQTFHQHPEARGVGLFQVKNRMKSIGGDVTLESELGVGTTVTLNFN